jgi:Arabinose efflux permease
MTENTTTTVQIPGDIQTPSQTPHTRLPDITTTSRGLGASIWSQFLLRLASSAGLLVIGSYFVDLQSRGVPLTSMLIGGIAALVYLTELLFAPLAGALSDARGRRLFLLAGPALAGVAVLLLPSGSLITALPPLGLVLTLVSISRLIEGVGGAISVPATLSFLSEGTDGNPVRRGREMSFYELASSGGIAIGALLGPLLWSSFHLWAFVVISIIYFLSTGLVLLFVQEKRTTGKRDASKAPLRLRRYITILTTPHLFLFMPAWIAVNAILGIWITSQIVFVLAGKLHVPGQVFVGSLYHKEAVLSAYLGGYVLLFSICIVAWAFFIGRLPKLPVLLASISGSALASIGLVGMNHSGPLAVFMPITTIGIFLEAGFTPAALAYLADQSRTFANDRGLVMGLYSVILGIGNLLGNVLGGIFAQIAYFDGLALLTIIFVLIGMASITSLLVIQRRENVFIDISSNPS